MERMIFKAQIQYTNIAITDPPMPPLIHSFTIV